MNKTQAERLIVLATVVFMVSVVGGQLKSGGVKNKKDFGRKLTAGFFAMLFAALLAEALPEIGALLALSIGFYAFLHDGLPAIGVGFAQTPQEKKQYEALAKKEPRTPTPPRAEPIVAESLSEQRLV